ncbi:MAG: ParB/RepB/Spo0J family partition protein [Saprospiraceae bacterium]|uniref:ParB/RepB/Spo0J family partition protein n=1 Tax=Candidatus Brachybacter algidus TaxID=2982024 RepID=UPI001B4F1815|nr:ParB/RepB/Spo0J family partition protein [Candidatus Brachybacter algidus]MBP7306915.1 ParB/RepB/Spo0J family partition protein [Saprospiraceae bacterium]MBP7539944.1 ParB/RepB/Spo0J family partition protein [Saprospiraceae bacterium]MBP8892722.1 ParB/RepB/Spo0J family partition protein [Saprospiraceae bacterium]MBP9124887.1 ParB/RepB/Spo0J family partition protein [Saprospiraceae bacterium]MBP9846438.1 ParB/RepB/Spo0J family partition protein [Saprospiraceae bacterium]
MKKKELGRGIRALLNNMESEDETPTLDTVKELSGGIAIIALSEIEPNPTQPRTRFSDAQLKELAQSITSFGIIQPLTLRKIGRDKFQIIAGERRFKAAQLAGLKEVPAYVRLANDQELFEMALVENIQREDLNAIEIAISYKRLMEETNLTQDVLSERIGKDRSTIANYVRLLKLLPDIQNAVKEKQISMGHARALAGIDDIALQLAFYKQAVSNRWSVRQLENNIREHFNKKTGQKSTTKVEKDPIIESLKEKLKMQYGLKVQIDRNEKGQGFVKISFNSNDELNQILDVIDK